MGKAHNEVTPLEVGCGSAGLLGLGAAIMRARALSCSLEHDARASMRFLCGKLITLTFNPQLTFDELAGAVERAARTWQG